MTRILTYSLKADASNSHEYYRTISAFADFWLARTRREVHDLVTGFHEYRQHRCEPDRSEAEYIFELLALGVLIREHGESASHMPRWVERLMHRLVAIQNRQPRAENLIKALRGWLGWIPGPASGRERRDDIAGLMIAWLRADDETRDPKGLLSTTVPCKGSGGLKSTPIALEQNP